MFNLSNLLDELNTSAFKLCRKILGMLLLWKILNKSRASYSTEHWQHTDRQTDRQTDSTQQTHKPVWSDAIDSVGESASDKVKISLHRKLQRPTTQQSVTATHSSHIHHNNKQQSSEPCLLSLSCHQLSLPSLFHALFHTFQVVNNHNNGVKLTCCVPR